VLMSLLVIAAASCALSLLLTPLARHLAAHWGLLDRPDGRRKVHARATPVVGGPALYLACAGALFAALAGSPQVREFLLPHAHALLGLLLAAVVICAVGIADDQGRLHGRHKLAGQVLAILILVAFGVSVNRIHLFGWDIELGLLAVPFTVLWLLGAINALNLLDGVDGLLNSVGLIVCVALAVLGLLQDQPGAACVATALAGALLGFLRYNFPPASVFLGDSGSMLIGLVIGTLAIQGGLKGPATVALAAPTALLTIPFLDTVAAIVRRKFTGRSIYTTDRGHLHHCLERRGFSSRGILLCVSLFCLLTVCGALATQALRSEVFAVASALAVIAILVVSGLFGQAECVLVREQFRAAVRDYLNVRSTGRGRQIEVRFQGSGDWKGLWDALVHCARGLDLKTVRLNVNAPALGEGYHAQWGDARDDTEEATLWRAEIPLSHCGHTLGRLEISGPREGQAMWLKIAAVAEVLIAYEVLSPAPAPAGPVLLAARALPPAAVVEQVSARR
jgi:UDP-GlcNAc:undecaprenyl-phosphate GlcNAc-1-phosphate transferase